MPNFLVQAMRYPTGELEDLIFIDNGDGTLTFTVRDSDETYPSRPEDIFPGTGIIVKGFQLGETEILAANSFSVDAFSRWRVSNPTALFDAKLSYDLGPLVWESALTGGGTVTYVANSAAARMLLTTGAGDKVVRQSHGYFRYQAGKSQLLAQTAVLGVAKANVRRRVGYFDAQNGVFFEQTGAGLFVVQRSNVSGAPADNTIAQANWNLDTLDGNGPSGITLDPTKAQIFIIDLQWLGVGRVRFGFDIGGVIVYCHQILNANVLTSVYMTTAILPVRLEIENTGAAASATDMFQICSSVVSEGGYETLQGLPFSANTGTTNPSVNARTPIMSIRPALLFAGLTNRIVPQLDIITILAGSGTVFWELVYNGTLTGPAFAAVDANSSVERDVTASAIAGGTVIDSGYLSGGAATARVAASHPLLSQLPLTLNIAGTVQDRLTLVGTGIGGAVNVSASINWKELR